MTIRMIVVAVVRVVVAFVFVLSISISSSSSRRGSNILFVQGEEIFSSDCPCINSSAILLPLSNCTVKSTGELGVKPHKTSEVCLPITYGSSICEAHDVGTEWDGTIFRGGPSSLVNVHDCALDKWCFVDYEKCKLSKELFAYADFFAYTNKLFVSYTTCDSIKEKEDYGSSDCSFAGDAVSSSGEIETAVAMAFERDQALIALEKETTLTVTVPALFYPHHYKVDPETQEISRDDALYYNTDVPFQGVMIDYLDTVVGKGSTAIEKIDYVVRSKASDSIYDEKLTAAVHDIQLGISDLAVGPFWVTTERLQMTTFTTPGFVDSIYLVTTKPQVNNSFEYQIIKVLYPFSMRLWVSIISVVVAVAALSIWFAGPKTDNQQPYISFRNNVWKQSSTCRRIYITARQLLEALLQNGIFFLGQGTPHDHKATLSYKILMFGYSFFIMITAASYVANLAAFLTLDGVGEYVDSMDKATGAGLRVCAHPTVQYQLESRYPDANFVYNTNQTTHLGMLHYYREGKCDVIVASYYETRYNVEVMQQFCDLGLIFTEHTVLEVPMAFPVRQDLVSTVSRWIMQGERRRKVSLDLLYEYREPILSCNVNLNTNFVNELPSLTITYMVGPFLLLAYFLILASFFRLCQSDKYNSRVSNFLQSPSGSQVDTQQKASFLISLANFLNLQDQEDGIIDEQDEEQFTLKNVIHHPIRTFQHAISHRHLHYNHHHDHHDLQLTPSISNNYINDNKNSSSNDNNNTFRPTTNSSTYPRQRRGSSLNVIPECNVQDPNNAATASASETVAKKFDGYNTSTKTEEFGTMDTMDQINQKYEQILEDVVKQCISEMMDNPETFMTASS